jgi:hypothetical protein
VNPSKRPESLAKYPEPEDNPRDGEQSPAGGGRPRLVMQHQEERDIREQLTRLRAEHRELDGEIASLEAGGGADQLTVSRLKKRKLKLKDLITSLEDKLFPDIIA